MKYALTLLAALTVLPAQAEIFMDVGINGAKISRNLAGDHSHYSSTGAHLGLGARREASDHSDIGVRMELDNVDNHNFFAVRALDYRYRFNDKLAISAFVGAARYDLATPAYGYYLGTGIQYRDIMPHWDLGMDLRYGDNVARDKLLPSDPQGNSPDYFYNIAGLSLYLSYRF
ncbi:hypothetical protein PVT67_00700 [Gallaecimonas kandeliae]|uniref:hypothetical protein n=1 Tax=Gallaecimonas kandeliae TaxID=3029055 RepID=UPI00264953F8|nr:hypothetical protein [Gallaecimonas kandeliae]WKE65809.1 hypothetical protein PVT67_00700 [Gallaecimonas kandeliae]